MTYQQKNQRITALSRCGGVCEVCGRPYFEWYDWPVSKSQAYKLLLYCGDNMKDRNIFAGDNWKTPEKLYNDLNNEFCFDFDPCPYSEDLYIPPEKDGLIIEWGQCNFVNPPYSRKLKEAFVRRGVEMQEKGKTSVFLLPVSTSTKLFHHVIKPNATEIRFLEGRVHFAGYNTKGIWVENQCGMFDSMIVVFRGII